MTVISKVFINAGRELKILCGGLLFRRNKAIISKSVFSVKLIKEEIAASH